MQTHKTPNKAFQGTRLKRRAPELQRYVCVKTVISVIVIAVSIFAAVPGFAHCEERYMGLYTWGAEVDVFQSCGSSKTYWVSASSWTQVPLIEFVKEKTKKPYQPVYIEFRGCLLNEKLDGFAEQYDGLIHMSEIYVMSDLLPVKCRAK